MEKRLLSALLTRYQKLPESQRLPELDAAFGKAAELAAKRSSHGFHDAKHLVRRAYATILRG